MAYAGVEAERLTKSARHVQSLASGSLVGEIVGGGSRTASPKATLPLSTATWAASGMVR
ncbi:MAG: hypothetical protein H0X71_10440 [Rubrobacter sp.]|nr:hypothetical protein [Rubrobacter sp.]